jgi:hypothetical protein
MVNNVHCDFYGSGSSSVNERDGILRGRPYGGLAILYRKSLGNMFRVVEYDNERI